MNDHAAAAAMLATGALTPNAASGATDALLGAKLTRLFIAASFETALIVLHHFLTRSDTKLGMRL